MRKIVRVSLCVGLSILLAGKTRAQVKGNPVFEAVPQQLKLRKTNAVISPELQQLYDNSTGTLQKMAPDEKALAPNGAMNKYMQVRKNRVLVDIVIKKNITATKAGLRQLGMQITGVYGRVVSGLIPVTALSRLGAMQAVQFAHAAYLPIPHAGPLKPSFPPHARRLYENPDLRPVISQGDTAQRSNLARELYDVNGTGVKVGILSDSYNAGGTADAGVLQGELPGPGNPFNFLQPVEILQDLNDSSGTDEGRALAEIVHDVAPGAALAFHTAFAGEANFAQGIQDLANKGCRIIVDDVSYFDEPFFQDGILAQSVDLARSRGVVYVSSAGNNFNNSYESDFRSSSDEVMGAGNGTAHNFSDSGDSPRYYQPIFIPSGGSFVTSFQWDQPAFSAGGSGAESDLDIYLLDMYGNVVAAGITNNIKSGDPVEVMGYDNRTPNNTFFLVIVKFAGPDPSRLKYIMYRDARFYNVSSPAIPGIFAPTVAGHAKAEGAITTAAAYYRNTPAYGVDTPRVEWFSSLGGVPHYFDANGSRITASLRRKPDFTAPDGGITSFFDPPNRNVVPPDGSYPSFFGTSAAAAHAAGAAALMIQAAKRSHLTPPQVKGILSSHTLDMYSSYPPGFGQGFNFNTGYGFIKVDEAVAEVKFPRKYISDLDLNAVCSVDPSVDRSWKIINPNAFDVEINWLLLGTSQHGSITAPPGESSFTTGTLYVGSYPVPNIVVIDWKDNFGFTRLDIATSNDIPCGSTTAARTITPPAVNNGTVRPLLAEVYPNPAADMFKVYLALPEGQPVQLQLFTAEGKRLMEKQLSLSKTVVPIDAAGLKAGLYILQVKQGTFHKTIKLVKQ